MVRPFTPGATPYMRRRALLAATFALAGMLPGCAGSGFYSYLGDTFTLPFGANPNMAKGSSETDTKVRAQYMQTPPPILYEAGDIWPEPPKAPPTLKDLQRQQNQDLARGVDGTGTPTGGYAPLQPLPQLPGYEVPEQQSHAAPPVANFPAGIVPLPGGRPGIITGGGGELKSLNGPTGNGSIVVPNGNGTSTVIGPNGSVSTIPSPGK